MRQDLIILLASFLLSLIAGGILIPFLRRRKAGQPILHYVAEHSSKAGTPTMGGWIFILGITLAILPFALGSHPVLLALAIMTSYGVVGFLDDFLKVRRGNNKGLSAWQKAGFQLIIACIAAFYARELGTRLVLPFAGGSLDLGGWYLPFAVFVFLAATNGVNLTDGLDGLAARTVLGYLLAFFVLLALGIRSAEELGDPGSAGILHGFALLSAAAMGGLLAFLLFNAFPAKVFMGDTGSLALGGLIAAMALFTPYALFLPLFGVMFVVSCLSVILQVASFKLTRKRIFLMAPFHHHLQMKGMHENRITALYFAVTAAVSAFTLIFCL